MRSKNAKTSVERVMVAMLLILAAFVFLIGRLAYIQIVKADEYRQKQTDLITHSETITASRGDIYDRNMNILAKDATCAKIVVYPKNLIDPDLEDGDQSADPRWVAEVLAEKLVLDYDSVYEKVTSDVSEVTIKRRVEYLTALEIDTIFNEDRADDLSQYLAVFEDKKRYYTDSSFAQYVLGFTNVDHVGAYGIEAEYNSVLQGIDGVETVIQDANGRKLESLAQMKVDAIQGSNLVLSLDSIMQYYVENLVYEAYLENEPKRVMAVVGDPDTGEILAYAVYPGYDLSDPWTVPRDFIEAMGEDDDELGELQLEMWKNMLTSFIYEPGSTFKIITTTSALEENIVTLGSTYNCVGVLNVAGVPIRCHVYPASHGHEDLADAVSNSCNPAMMKISMEMGPDIFYKYIYNYGFSVPTGIDLDGEESGILSVNQDVNLVDFVTLSFGQGLGVTPIQMLQALNAAVNGGELLVPRMAKYVVDSQTNEITTEFGKELVRQVISESTSEKIREIMHFTANNNYALMQNCRGLKIGGKTGTAQKFENGRYLVGRYVASFYGMIPYDDPELSVLVLVDEPSGTYTTGGSVAAPVGGEILKVCYEYLTNQTLEETPTDGEVIARVFVPDVRGKKLSEAAEIFSALGIKYETKGAENGIVTAQEDILIEYKEDDIIVLTVSEESDSMVKMPDLRGMSVSQVKDLLDSLGLEYIISGGGIASSQSIEHGTETEKGTVVEVIFSYIE